MSRPSLFLLAMLLTACASRAAEPEPPAPRLPRPSVDSTAVGREVPGVDSAGASVRVLERARGEATYYSDALAGRLTASGIPYRPGDLIAAHRSYPFGTRVRVTNLRNGRSIILRIVDRGPWGTSERARRTIIDVSRRAAERLGFLRDGRVPVLVEVLSWGRGDPGG